MAQSASRRIDTHVHVGVLGDDPEFQRYGAISPWMRRQLVYRIMLLYARVEPDRVSDRTLHEAALRAVRTSTIDHVVCLALDPVYDTTGRRREDLSNMWVDNSYITRLQQDLARQQHGSGERILLGASVHPYDPEFQARVQRCVTDGAVLLKWLPSAQQIDLADSRVRNALMFLATARDGRALPLLLHVGPEYAIMTTDPRTTAYDFISWGFWDRVRNRLRPSGRRWTPPALAGVLGNLRAGIEAGASIILAHCGLPYFAPRGLGFLEHSDFAVVRALLRESLTRPERQGKCYADVSACVTPFRRGFFKDIATLPEQLLLAGSDFPVPVFELSTDIGEHLRDFAAMIRDGDLSRVVVPADNLLDVNWRELKHAFGEHAMFRNATTLLQLPRGVSRP